MTLKKELVLKLDVGLGTVIRDVQLWSKTDADSTTNSTASSTGSSAVTTGLCEVVGMINVSKLPLWLDTSAAYHCFSTSETTFNYFRAKLMRQRHRNRGILCKLLKPRDSVQYLLFYKRLHTDANASFEIECVAVSFATKHLLDNLLQPAAAVAAPLKSIDSILEKNKRQRLQKNASLNKQVLLNDHRQHFVSMLSQCILSGLRLRNVSQSQYEKLYKMTYQACEFAFRNELKLTQTITFESVQECVETLLRLFTKT